jgi:plasmid stabilization system protein ParE
MGGRAEANALGEMRRTQWSRLATQDLAGIDAYLAEIDPDLADTFDDAVLAACSFLLDHPHAGPAVKLNVRKWRVRNSHHLLIYRIVDGGIRIVRIDHARQDWLLS